MQFLTSLSLHAMLDNTLNISFIRHYIIKLLLLLSLLLLSLHQQAQTQEK